VTNSHIVSLPARPIHDPAEIKEILLREREREREGEKKREKVNYIGSVLYFIVG
jgi:hypothetical protein